jgi:small subunit ribosomal protein S14
MAKKSSIEKNNRRKRMTTLKLAQMPRNSSATRIRNRCELSGRPRSIYRKNKLSRIALRELGSKGLVPGLVKSSW